jgi:hypothetical protein
MARESLHHAGTTASFTTKSASSARTSTIFFYCQFLIVSLPIKFVAAEAGFFPPGPWTDFADMLFVVCELLEFQRVASTQ